MKEYNDGKEICVLIPCYNESLTIDKVVRDFRSVLPEAKIYVYDNNSQDGTDEIARRAGAIVRYERCQGKGNVIRSMFRDINSQCYLMVDGDDTYPAENAKEMVEAVMNEGYDMVVGDRLSTTYFDENKRPFHNLGNVLVRKMLHYLFHSEVKDVMTGYRAFSKKFVKNCPIMSNGFEIETEITCHALDKHFRVKEIPIQYRDRPKGSISKLNTFSDGFSVLITIAKIYRNYKPFYFFGFFSLLFFLIATWLVFPVVTEYLKTGLVPRFPTLIASGFLFVCGLLFFFCGLILNTISQMHKQSFEQILNN